MRTLSIFSSRAVNAALLVAFALMASACAAPVQKRTSLPEPAPSMSIPSVPAIPAPVFAPVPSATEPQNDSGAVTQSPSAAIEIAKPISHIALLLPLASRTFGQVADALKLGFIAGADADGKNAPAYRIYTADDEGAALAAQYRKAVNEGAAAIIGGVTRDGANTIARESRFLPTLALNAPAISSDNELPDQFFYISLNLDLEAKLVARMAFGDGLRNLAMLVANTPLAKRVQDSFEQEWARLGGGISTRIAFGNDPGDATRVASAMEKINERIGTRADGVFLAADTASARVIRPYLPTGMPVFATSHTVDPRADPITNLDLENVRFLEMPWFAEQDHPAVMGYAKPRQTLPVEYERLYALGIDAWRLALLIVQNTGVRTLPALDGVTGRITRDGHQLLRALTSVEVRDGKAQLYRPAE